MRLAKQSCWFVAVVMWTLGCHGGEAQREAAPDAGGVKASASVTEVGSRATTPDPDNQVAVAPMPGQGRSESAASIPAGMSAEGAGDRAVGPASGAKDAGAAGSTVGGDASTASPGADAGPLLDPEIVGALSAVDPMRIESSIATLSGFTTRNTCSDNSSSGDAIGAARDWIEAQFQAASQFTASTESFSTRGCRAMGTAHNVIAVKRGRTPERVLVIGGHYDSRSINGSDPTSVAPGANDSGSQTAALIEVVRALAPLELDATILIAAFAGEEQGLLGSAQLASEYTTYTAPDATIEAMFNMDIVGGDNTVNTEATLQQFRLYSPGTPRELNTPMGTTDDTSPARGVMRYIERWGGLYVPSMTMLPMLREDRPGRGGDQTSFHDLGIAAVRFIEAVETENAGTNASHQHSANDLPMYVTPSYTARVAQIVLAVSASLARAPMAPQLEGVTAGSGDAWSVRWSPPTAGPPVDHYLIAARPTSENFYRARVRVPAGTTSREVTAAELGVDARSAFFVSVAAVDAAGHESLFSYPEHRCESGACSVQPGSLAVTARN